MTIFWLYFEMNPQHWFVEGELFAHLRHASLTNGEAPLMESQVIMSDCISSTRDGYKCVCQDVLVAGTWVSELQLSRCVSQFRFQRQLEKNKRMEHMSSFHF